MIWFLIWGDNSPACTLTGADSFRFIKIDINGFQSHVRIILGRDWNARVGKCSRPDYVV